MLHVLGMAAVMFFSSSLLICVAELRAESAMEQGRALIQKELGAKNLSESASKQKIQRDKVLGKAVAKVNALNKQAVVSERARTRSTIPKSEILVKPTETLYEAALLHHNSRKDLERLGLSPRAASNVLTGEVKPQEDIWDWAVFASCFTIGCGVKNVDCNKASCYCHCVAVAHDTIPKCKNACGLGVSHPSPVLKAP
jgi:hypothetical protein